MKIIRIFAQNLFSFKFENEVLNEYERLLEMWNNPEYLLDFAEKNKSYLKGCSLEEFVECVLDDVLTLEYTLKQYAYSLNSFFQPLDNNEIWARLLSLQKRRCRYLRLYAIKIDDNMFVVTGGAIKLTRTMSEHPDTVIELAKMNRCKEYLKSEGIFDEYSFFETLEI
jgi:hypothetical protein